MYLPSFDQILFWLKDNQLIAGLIGSAIIGAMPELLPTWREFPQWIWTWIRDSSKTFLNFRRLTLDGPQQPRINPPLPNQKAELVTTQIPRYERIMYSEHNEVIY